MKKHAWIALLMIGGCAAETDSSSEISELASRMGVDYSFDRPSPSGLGAAGYTFAARYLSSQTCKNLTANEASTLGAAGIDIVVNWENDTTDVQGKFNGGVAAAVAAEQETAAAGMPGGRPIYFAIDFDAQVGDQATINAYFDGVASVIGTARVGAYGGYGPISRLFDAGKIVWGWQTFAWSNGMWDTRAQLRQVQDGVTIAGGGCDIDQAMAPDFVQWRNTAPPQSPQRCSGYDCDNLDPTQSAAASTGALCSSGSWTVISTAANNGTLEMRWGPSCQVNWARFTPSASGTSYRLWIERESPGCAGSEFLFQGAAGVQYFSNQVYAPGRARACVELWDGSSGSKQACTPFT